MTDEPLQRYQDWEARLLAAIEATPPFEWAEHDCCRFAARCVTAITGVDPMAGAFDGLYTGAASATRLLYARGGLPAALDDVLGMPLASPLLAQRGDVVLAAFGPDAGDVPCLLFESAPGDAAAGASGEVSAAPFSGGIVGPLQSPRMVGEEVDMRALVGITAGAVSRAAAMANIHRWTVTISVGDRLAGQGRHGVEYLPLAAGLRAWRI